MMVRLRGLDLSQFLNDRDSMEEHLRALSACGDPEVLRSAVNDVIRAQGIRRLARDTGIDPDILYETLTPGGEMRMAVLDAVIGALGLSLREHEEPPQIGADVPPSADAGAAGAVRISRHGVGAEI